MLRMILVLLVTLLVFLGAGNLIAEDNNLSVTAPTELETGEPLEDLAAINFWHQVDGGDWTFLARVETTEPGSVVTYLHANQFDGVHCYRATAVRANGLESDPSNVACKTVDTILPGAPTGMTVR